MESIEFHDVDEIEINGSSETDPKKIADNFNDFFVNIRPNLAKKNPQVQYECKQLSKGGLSTIICLLHLYMI